MPCISCGRLLVSKQEASSFQEPANRDLDLWNDGNETIIFGHVVESVLKDLSAVRKAVTKQQEVDQVRRQYKQLTSFWKLHRRDSSATIPDLSGSWTLTISCNSPNLLPPSRHSHVVKAFSPANLEKIEQTLRSVSADHWSLSHLVSSK